MKFDSYHPAINLIYFTAVTAFTVSFHHPVYLAIAYVSAFAYSVKLNGIRAMVFNLCLIPLILAYGAWYSYYNHFGSTYIRQNFIGNEITLEAVVFGLVIGVTAATVIMIMSCVFAVFSSDKVVYLFGRVSPKLSLFLSIMLRSIPRIKQTAVRVNVSRRGIGRGCGQGTILRRLTNMVCVFSILITWTAESFIESSQSMKSRGYSLRGRTAFSIYRFDNRDRCFVVAIFLCLTFIAVAVAFNQTNIYYDPQIVMNRVTPVSYVFYAVYGILFCMPLVLQIKAEILFGRSSKGIDHIEVM
ncbi:MAG: energy-coupling factor transporter transmembrane protein EcfT [Clostridiales bacterium]|nr:energy-coupling factor transporter transmembrane protein EcfT [Clostridiales bacterium]